MRRLLVSAGWIGVCLYGPVILALEVGWFEGTTLAAPDWTRPAGWAVFSVCGVIVALSLIGAAERRFWRWRAGRSDAAIEVVPGLDALTVVDGAEGIRTFPWADLTGVSVITTADGPFYADFHLVLDFGARLVPIDGAARGFDVLIERLIRDDRFDHRRFIEACGSTDRAFFDCWRVSAASV